MTNTQTKRKRGKGKRKGKKQKDKLKGISTKKIEHNIEIRGRNMSDK